MANRKYNGEGTLHLKTSVDDIYFCSDLHYGHKNMVKSLSNWEHGANRPHSSLEEMNQDLVTTINDKVSKDAVLFVAGDFAYPDPADVLHFRKQINCENVIMVLGNHDQYIKKHYAHFIGEGPGRFQAIRAYMRIRVDDQQIVMSHYPMLVWDGHHRGYWHLHGHCHGSLKPAMPEYYDRKVLDIGWDASDKGVWSYAEVQDYMTEKSIEILDHHGKTGSAN